MPSLGLSTEAFLLLAAAAAILGLVLLVTHFKVHPFLALTLASGFLGLTSGMPAERVVTTFQEGFGSVLGFVGIVLGLGTMLGKLMAESGGAAQIARTLVATFGRDRVHWATMLGAFLVGIPLFFEIGFVLLMPIVFILARETGISIVRIGIPLLAGLSVMHGLVPPHPGPLFAIDVFGADIGRTIFYGLVVGLPTAIVSGPLFAVLISRVVPGSPAPDLADEIAHAPEAENPPGFAVTLVTVLLPVALMMLKSVADIWLPEGSRTRAWMDFAGNPITALLAALLLSLHTFGAARGFGARRILGFLDASLGPTAAILLIIGAGGGFKQMLVATGIGTVIGNMAVQMHLSPLLLAWLAAAVIRIATGSATVATITGAGIVAPVAALVPDVDRELLVLALGAGSLTLSHVNDAGFWLVKQYFNMTVAETLATWTAMETIISVVAMVLVLVLAAVV